MTQNIAMQNTTVRDIVRKLNLEISNDAGLEREITGGYASDLLSCVLAGAQAGNIWVTLQAHVNVIAVASLLGLSAVIITEGVCPDRDTLDKAREVGVTVLTSGQNTFAVVGQLAALGVR